MYFLTASATLSFPRFWSNRIEATVNCLVRLLPRPSAHQCFTARKLEPALLCATQGAGRAPRYLVISAAVCLVVSRKPVATAHHHIPRQSISEGQRGAASFWFWNTTRSGMERHQATLEIGAQSYRAILFYFLPSTIDDSVLEGARPGDFQQQAACPEP